VDHHALQVELPGARPARRAEAGDVVVGDPGVALDGAVPAPDERDGAGDRAGAGAAERGDAIASNAKY
jgi:hypothetical protein